MGRVKSTAIKRAARTLVSENTELTGNFEENKKVLKSYSFPDKGTRNRIAGYIVRLKKSNDENKKA